MTITGTVVNWMSITEDGPGQGMMRTAELFCQFTEPGLNCDTQRKVSFPVPTHTTAEDLAKLRGRKLTITIE